MPVLRSCCFFLPLREAAALIGLVSVVLASVGIMISVFYTLKLLPLPKDFVQYWILQIIYFAEFQGIVFHTLFFLVSTMLTTGAILVVPHLLVPWMFCAPVMWFAMLLQVILSALRKPEYSFPLAAFFLMISLLLFYSTIIVASYFKVLHEFYLIMRRAAGPDAEFPRRGPCPDCFYFIPSRHVYGTGSTVVSVRSPQYFSSQNLGSTTALDTNVMRERLTEAYAKLKSASKQSIVPEKDLDKEIDESRKNSGIELIPTASQRKPEVEEFMPSAPPPTPSEMSYNESDGTFVAIPLGEDFTVPHESVRSAPLRSPPSINEPISREQHIPHNKQKY